MKLISATPGVWLFHCHIEWHMDSGLAATFIEAPLELQKTLKIPEDHYQVCEASGTLTAGNAAGNTKDLFDLTGQNVSPAPLPAGFTAKGIVALVFSCIAAILGLLSIAWYDHFTEFRRMHLLTDRKQVWHGADYCASDFLDTE
jgi:iron transport multicopper oxidase